MDDWSAAVAAIGGLAVLCLLLSLSIVQLDRRTARLERIQKLHDWEEDATLPRWESIGQTGNVHRRKLGWRVRLVLWWVRLRGQ